MAVKAINPGENFRGMSYGNWVALWSNWLFSSYPRYLPSDDIIFLRGFLEYFDPLSEISTRHLITEEVVTGRRDPDAPADKDSKYKDIQRITERRLFLNKVTDRDETFAGDVVPEKTALFMPLITTMYWIGGSFEGRHLEDEMDVRRAVRTDTYESREIWAWYREDRSSDWDHVVKKLKPDYRIESPMFTLRVSEESQFSVNTRIQPGNYDAVTGGYFIILDDLPKGQYYFRFGGKGRDNYRTESQYWIKVDGIRRDFVEQVPPPGLGPKNATRPLAPRDNIMP